MARHLIAGTAPADDISTMINGCLCPVDQTLAALLKFAAGALPAPVERKGRHRVA